MSIFSQTNCHIYQESHAHTCRFPWTYGDQCQGHPEGDKQPGETTHHQTSAAARGPYRGGHRETRPPHLRPDVTPESEHRRLDIITC